MKRSRGNKGLQLQNGIKKKEILTEMNMRRGIVRSTYSGLITAQGETAQAMRVHY